MTHSCVSKAIATSVIAIMVLDIERKRDPPLERTETKGGQRQKDEHANSKRQKTYLLCHRVDQSNVDVLLLPHAYNGNKVSLVNTLL